MSYKDKNHFNHEINQYLSVALLAICLSFTSYQKEEEKVKEGICPELLGEWVVVYYE